jgi:L-ribulose-5-phosphate 3-epimerase
MKFAAFSGALIDYSMREAMLIVQKLGFDGIEIACREPHLSTTTSAPRIKEIKRLADDLGLRIPALAGYMGNFSVTSDSDCESAFEEFQKMLQIGCELDASMIRVQPGGPNAFLAKEYHYAKAAYWLHRCALEAKSVGKKIVLEIHNQSLVENVESSLHLLRLIDCDNVGMIHDAGNMYITDTDYGRDSVLKLGNRLFHVHVKDEKRVNEVGERGTFINITRHGEEKFMHCRLGEGKADHKPLFDTLREIGYEQWVTLECNAPFPPAERLEYDLRQVKKHLCPTTA